jgi:flagellar motor switch protein FliG
MSFPRAGGLAAAAVAAFLCVSGARAAEQGERMGAVVAARLELQQRLGTWLTQSLAGAAEPYRVEASVSIEMRGVVREVRNKQANATPSVRIGAKSKVKLPGLGMVDGGGGQTGLVPEINIEGGQRVTESVTRQLETEVTKYTIRLFVDPEMPKDRRELLARLAGELVGIDTGRGDEVVVSERRGIAGAAGGGGLGGATVVQATVQPSKQLPWEVLAVCVTALAAAAILAAGLSRRGRDGGLGAALGRGGGGERRGEGGAEAAKDGSAVPMPPGAWDRRRRRDDLRAFQVLADVTPEELVQVIAESDPHTAAAIADLVGLDDDAAALVEKVLPPQRRVDLGIGLATSRVLTREQLGQMEAVATQVLAKVRNRVPLGGPDRLAGFLSRATPKVRREVLEGVAARDPRVADAARKELLLFEDLPRLADASLRQIAASVDASTVALALVGAEDIRELVYGSVSKRLRGILEAEAEILQEKPPQEIEEARRAVEAAMRQLGDRGELQSRAA